MRIVHTADWHLGHTLNQHSRDAEHAAFLDGLLKLLVALEADALLIAGDVFDSANPPVPAQRQLYDFFARLRRELPRLTTVVIGGNHDSPGRLEAPLALLAPLGVRVLGQLHREHGQLADRHFVPLSTLGGVAAWVGAIPFLRPSDLGSAGEAGARAIYAEAVTQLRARQAPGQALLLMGHCHLAGSQTSEGSERRILVGGAEAWPADLLDFPDVAYVALGHLHLAQAVGGRDHIRYSGSPLPLNFGEINYQHQIVALELEGARLVRQAAIPVPRAARLCRVPEQGAALLPAVLADLAARTWSAAEAGLEPLLEVNVLCEHADPTLRQQIEQVLAEQPVRLAAIRAHRPERLPTLQLSRPSRLDERQPTEVFAEMYQRERGQPPDATVLAAFHELLLAAEQDTTA